MATRKEFHLLQLKWEGPIGRNSVQGGTIVGDYIQSGGERTIVVRMPKVEKKAGKKQKKATPVAKAVQDAIQRQRMEEAVDQQAEVTRG